MPGVQAPSKLSAQLEYNVQRTVGSNSETISGTMGHLHSFLHLFARDLSFVDILVDVLCLPHHSISTADARPRRQQLFGFILSAPYPSLYYKPFCGPSSHWKEIRYTLLKRTSTNIPFLTFNMAVPRLTASTSRSRCLLATSAAACIG